MIVQRKDKCKMQCKLFATIFVYLHVQNVIARSGVASNYEENNEDLLYALCGCPFGYFEVSRFLLSTSEPPKCVGKEVTSNSKEALEGYQCQRCHSSCFGCHGPTDGDCNQCGIKYLKSMIYARNPDFSMDLESIINEVEIEDERRNRKARDIDDRSARVHQDQSKVLEEFATDLNEDHLLPLTKQIADGEYDLGSGSEARGEDYTLDESSATEAINIPREDRSTGSTSFQERADQSNEYKVNTEIYSTVATERTIDIFEEVIYTISPTTTTKRSIIRKKTKIPEITTHLPEVPSITENSTEISDQLIPRVISTPSSVKFSLPSTELTPSSTTIESSTPIRTRKPKLRKHPKISTTSQPPNSSPNNLETSSDDVNLNNNAFWCVSTCPDGTYPDFRRRMCHPCDSKCQTCLGPSFMNCTSCTANSLRVSAARRSSRGLKTITCLSDCPSNEFAKNGSCIPCHEFCDGCTGAEVRDCLRCKYTDKPETEDQICQGPKDDPPSLLEIILPLVFVLLLVLFTIGICLRWNGNFKKVKRLRLTYFKLCRSDDNPNEPNSLEKQFPMKKARNEYTSSLPPSKYFASITEDGYELPLQSQAGPSGFSTNGSNTASIRSIKPRRNDPLPPTPLEMRAAQRKNSYLYDYYVNQPQKEQEPPKDNIEIKKPTPKNDAPQRKFQENGNQYANSNRLYANC